MATKKRNPALASLLSILTPGLGQVYNGQLKKGLLFFFSFLMLFYLILPFTGLQRQYSGMIALVILGLMFYLFVLVDAMLTAIQKKEIDLHTYNRWIVYLLIIVIVFGSFTIAYDFVQEKIWGTMTVRIPTGSMEPTLQIGDYLIADLKCYDRIEPRPGDLALFEYPPEKPNLMYIDRIIAVENQTVEIRNREVFVDRERIVDSSYVKHVGPQVLSKEFIDPEIKPSGAGNRDQYGPIRIPENSFFVMGDNRENSLDSRYRGPIHRKNIIGKALYINWARDKKRIGFEL